MPSSLPVIALGVATSSLGLLGCSPPATTSEEGKPAPRAVAPTPAPVGCSPASDGEVWTRFKGQRCDWELRDAEEAGRLALVDLDVEGAEPAIGEMPSACGERHCVYDGLHTEVGPIIMVTIVGADSEMPQSVQLGVVSAQTLVFVDLWEGAGTPVVTDLTAVGPAHCLAPFVCGDRLGVFAVPRLDVGQGLEPPPSLQARQGLLAEGGVVEAAERAGCVAIDVPLP